MVTVETTKDILFALDDCVLCKFIELVSKLLPLPPQIIKSKKPNKDILKYSPTKTFPLLKAGDDFIIGALPIVKYLIKSAKEDSDGVILDNRKILVGKNFKEEAKVDTWTNFIFSSIYPVTAEIEAQLYGKKKFNSKIFENALNDLMEVLEPVNNQLLLNAFLTSNNIQLPDLMLVSVLFKCYNDVLTKEKLEKIPNVVRVFKFVSHMKNFVELFGEATPCKKQKEPEPFTETKEEVEKEDKKGKKDKKENKKEENHNEEEKKEDSEGKGKKKNKKKNK
jgi:glutathione S-transferase